MNNRSSLPGYNPYLIPNTEDTRDYSFAIHYGSNLPLVLPQSLGRKALFVKDQGNTNICGGCSISTAKSFQDGIDFSEEYSYATIEEIIGRKNTQGVDPRSAMEGGHKIGFLPKHLAPFTWRSHGEAYISDWLNWSEALDAEAQKYAEPSYFKVDGPRDHFDNIRTALWNARDENAIVNAFSRWYSEFNESSRGILPDTVENALSYHAYTFIDWDVINDKEYLVAQLSSGVEYGNGGLLYFPRKLVNFLFSEYGTALYIYRKPDETNTSERELGRNQMLDLLQRLLTKWLPFFFKK